MVHALQAAHRRVRRGGIVIDARPDSSRRPRMIARRRVRGHLVQSDDADMRDAKADASIDRVVASGLFRRTGERGILWHEVTFVDLAELDEYLSDSGRYSRYTPGTRRALMPFRRGPLRMKRA